MHLYKDKLVVFIFWLLLKSKFSVSMHMTWLIGKDPDAEKDWGQEKGEREDEMVEWHH